VYVRARYVANGTKYGIVEGAGVGELVASSGNIKERRWAYIGRGARQGRSDVRSRSERLVYRYFERVANDCGAGIPTGITGKVMLSPG